MDLRLIQFGVACIDVAMTAVSWLILLCTYPDFARWRPEGFAEARQTIEVQGRCGDCTGGQT